MKTRKLVLIIADIVLLGIVIAQFIFLSKDGGKIFRLKETPDEIVIQNGNDNLVLKFENNQWVAGDNKYPTNMSTVDSMLESLTSIRCIDKAGSVTKQNALEKYELTEDKKISVTAKKDGAVLRSIDIGKSASTGSQNFITVDGGKDIYLATGGLRYDFDTTENQIRSKIVWEFDESQINTVEVIKTNDKENSFGISKTGSGENLNWLVSGAAAGDNDIELDTEKAQSWFDGLGSLTTSFWYDETKDLEKEFNSIKTATVNITHGSSLTSIDIYEIPVNNAGNDEENTEETPSYYGKSNETPYPFELTSYTMERLNKNLEELAK